MTSREIAIARATFDRMMMAAKSLTLGEKVVLKACLFISDPVDAFNALPDSLRERFAAIGSTSDGFPLRG